ncbi:MAG: hypothetical protein K2H98_08140 [Duncaniella sp.]|nr:hypothetical protein [Duncaniella sp.]
MIRRFFSAAVVPLVMALVASCSSGDRFEIKCDIDGLGTGRVDMIYFDGHYKVVTAHATDSRVTLTGHSAVPTLVDVWDEDGQLLFSLVAADGDRLKVEMDLADPLSARIEGNEPSELFARFRSDNAAAVAAGPSPLLDGLVERFVLANPSSQASTVALMTLYDLNADPVKADSLLNRLEAEARNLSSIRDFSRTLAVASASSAYGTIHPITFNIGPDSAVHFTPYRHSYSLLAVTSAPVDSATARLLRALRHDFKPGKLNLVETSAATDSARWRASSEADSATWPQTWLPGGLGNPTIALMAVPSTPYFIAVDSTGRQIYRGTSASAADSVLRSHL